MHALQDRIRNRTLVDPAACGVRLGIELREAAEREAKSAGMCLSHWIKQVVEGALKASGKTQSIEHEQKHKPAVTEPDNALNAAFNSAFAEEMEKLNT